MKKYFVGTLLILFLLPYNTHAVMQSLNGLTGQTQTFVNDTNFTISSGGTTHTLGWNGILPLSRGGTGNSSFTSNSIIFNDGGVLGSDSGFTFDKISGELDVPGALRTGNDLYVNGDAHFFAGIQFGGFPNFLTLDRLSATQMGIYTDSLILGGLEFGLLSNDRVFTFPDASGTLGLLEVENIFSNPVNKFVSDTDSTVHIGEDGIPGCIVMGDSDSSGVTYVTANDGVLSASTSAPSNCQ